MKGPRYRQNKGVIFRKEKDEAMLFNPDTSDVTVINSTGCLVWNLCNGSSTKREMAETVSNTYKVKLEKAKKDITKYLKVLEKRDFIKKVA